MKMLVRIDGKEYLSESTSECGVHESAKKLYDQMETTEKLTMILEDGSVLVAGKEAVQRAVFIFFGS